MTLRLLWALALLCLLGWGRGQRSDLQTVQAIQNVPLKVAQGTLLGQQAGGVAWFLRVPFAEPPVGGKIGAEG